MTDIPGSKGKTRRRRRHPAMKDPEELTRGERAADLLRNGMGSWAFVLIALAFLAGWMAANGKDGFDPYPFILLNLILSCLAALQGAILLIAAKRADSLSRDLAEHDFKTNVEAFEIIKEIRDLTRKIDEATARER